MFDRCCVRSGDVASHFRDVVQDSEMLRRFHRSCDGFTTPPIMFVFTWGAQSSWTYYSVKPWSRPFFLVQLRQVTLCARHPSQCRDLGTEDQAIWFGPFLAFWQKMEQKLGSEDPEDRWPNNSTFSVFFSILVRLKVWVSGCRLATDTLDEWLQAGAFFGWNLLESKRFVVWNAQLLKQLWCEYLWFIYVYFM